ncbi:hypothetical protein ACHAWT_002704 [Skeletonema menzelii]
MECYYYKEELDLLTGKGIIALVSDCRRLEVLELKNAKRVGRETIEEILRMLALAKESSAVAKAVISEITMVRLLFVRLLFRGTRSSLMEIRSVSKMPMLAMTRW